MSDEARLRAVEVAVEAGWQWAEREGIAEGERLYCARAYCAGHMTANESVRDATAAQLLRFADLPPERRHLAMEESAITVGWQFARDRREWG